MWVQQKDYKIVGAVLAFARKQSGLTQEALADRLKKPQSFVSSYESGQRRIDILELIRVAEALRTDSVEIFGQVTKKFQTRRR